MHKIIPLRLLDEVFMINKGNEIKITSSGSVCSKNIFFMKVVISGMLVSARMAIISLKTKFILKPVVDCTIANAKQ